MSISCKIHCKIILLLCYFVIFHSHPGANCFAAGCLLHDHCRVCVWLRPSKMICVSLRTLRRLAASRVFVFASSGSAHLCPAANYHNDFWRRGLPPPLREGAAGSTKVDARKWPDHTGEGRQEPPALAKRIGKQKHVYIYRYRYIHAYIYIYIYVRIHLHMYCVSWCIFRNGRKTLCKRCSPSKMHCPIWVSRSSTQYKVEYGGMGQAHKVVPRQPILISPCISKKVPHC